MKKMLVIMSASFALLGCQVAPTVPEKTSLEIQAIQARNFDADKSTVFKAVLSVLQDLGYVVSSASLETGFITAESPTKKDDSGSAVAAALFGGVRTELKTAVTASVEDMSVKTTRVRLNFVNKKFRSAQRGQQASDDSPVNDPKIYENAYEKIGEAVFIRQAQK